MGIINDNSENPHATTQIISKINNSIDLNGLYSKKEIDDKLLTKSNRGESMLVDGSHEMSGNLNMTSFKIVNLKDPISQKDAPHKKYVDNRITSLENKYLDKTTGGSINGDINMQNDEITNLQFQPSNNNSAISLGYLRSFAYVSLSEMLLWEYY